MVEHQSNSGVNNDMKGSTLDSVQWYDQQWHVGQTLVLPDFGRGVQVWRVELDCGDTVRAELYAYLSADERSRASRFKFAHHRDRFIAARGFLRLILASYTQQSPASLVFGYGDRGKPFLHPSGSNIAPPHFNVSHSDTVALYGISGDRPLGIDIESIRPISSATELAKRFFSESEYNVISSLPPDQQEVAFFRGWTRKEAYLKATGDGLAGLSSINIALLTPESVHTHSQISIADRWWLADIPLNEGLMGAIAVAISPAKPTEGIQSPTNQQPHSQLLNERLPRQIPAFQFFHLIPKPLSPN